MFDTNGYTTHREIVCKRSFYKQLNKPGVCNEKNCRHHAYHVEVSQSGVEYSTKDMYFESTCFRKESENKCKSCIGRYEYKTATPCRYCKWNKEP
jgi:hypothetical protein